MNHGIFLLLIVVIGRGFFLEFSQDEGIQSVVFSINNQLFSVLIEEVVEILRVPIITTVPGIHPTIEGVINLRGNIIPIINLHKRFHFQIPPAHKKNRIVIVQGKNEQIGLIVEEVRMVTDFDENNVEPPHSQTIDEDIFLGFAKLQDHVIGILNLEKVLYGYQQ